VQTNAHEGAHGDVGAPRRGDQIVEGPAQRRQAGDVGQDPDDGGTQERFSARGRR
jgi:hypothetical protein